MRIVENLAKGKLFSASEGEWNLAFVEQKALITLVRLLLMLRGAFVILVASRNWRPHRLTDLAEYKRETKEEPLFQQAVSNADSV